MKFIFFEQFTLLSVQKQKKKRELDRKARPEACESDVCVNERVSV